MCCSLSLLPEMWISPAPHPPRHRHSSFLGPLDQGFSILAAPWSYLGSFRKWGYWVSLLGVWLNWPGMQPRHQDLEKPPREF